ncbi:CAP domain-containing protein [Peribacillus sp. SCS-37]|uniref:CAP domain-containing protein n=1 Tax=Paraperibacillus esterisolvens TaxID=3115296 RepID=UPI003905D326
MSIVFFITGLYLNIGENTEDKTVLNGEKNIRENSEGLNGQNQKPTSRLPKPGHGISSIIGKNADAVIKAYGSPDRKDPTAYGYEWWIYNRSPQNYFQIGINDKKKAVTAYGIGNGMDVSPFIVGQPINDIFSKTNISSSVNFSHGGTAYRFELSEEDVNTRPIIKVGNIFAVLYLDKFTGSVSSVRFLDADTLVRLRPYELIYRGELPQESEPDEVLWKAIEEGNKQQIYSITNIIRNRFELGSLELLDEVSEVAYLHSKDMLTDQYFSHTSPTKGELEDRLQENEINYILAGENIAANYIDGAAAVEGWLNSKGHRDALLNEDFTGIGIGVYRKYYTQNFVKE